MSSRAFSLWRLAGLDDPVCLESVQVWLDPAGTPRGLCRWGYEEPLSFRYNAIISAAAPTAEARMRDADPYACPTAGEDLRHHHAIGTARVGRHR